MRAILLTGAAAALAVAVTFAGCDKIDGIPSHVENLAIHIQQEMDRYVPREYRCAVATAGVMKLDEDASLVRVLAWTGAQRAACNGLDENVDMCDVYDHVLTHADDEIPERYNALVEEAYRLRCSE
jgi:hypothetical protein